jgi:hypothetical protein
MIKKLVNAIMLAGNASTSAASNNINFPAELFQSVTQRVLGH